MTVTTDESICLWVFTEANFPAYCDKVQVRWADYMPEFAQAVASGGHKHPERLVKVVYPDFDKKSEAVALVQWRGGMGAPTYSLERFTVVMQQKVITRYAPHHSIGFEVTLTLLENGAYKCDVARVGELDIDSGIVEQWPQYLKRSDWETAEQKVNNLLNGSMKLLGEDLELYDMMQHLDYSEMPSPITHANKFY